jgi:2-C-methyl-D-erythritol 4-phosphate cytidylyltransferase
MMATFSVLLLTASPSGTTGETGGAFVKIDAREVLLRTVELFLNRENVKQIQVCFLPETLEEAKRKYAPHLSFSGVKVCSGGPKWIDQMVAGAAKIAAECTHVIVHDAARPALPYTDLEGLMELAEKHEAVALSAAVRTALVEVDEGGNAMAIHAAKEFMQLLSPAVYSRKTFEEMVKTKAEVHASGLQLLKGSALNIRVGASGDASLVKAMLNLLPKPKVKGPTNPFEEAQW